MPKRRAIRAIIELAVMYRALDDARDVSNHPYITTHPHVITDYGELFDLAGKAQPLPLPEVANKIIHSEIIEWDFTDAKEPLIVCSAAVAEHARFKWTKATIRITALGAVLGSLARKV